jgi:hypothetical protein
MLDVIFLIYNQAYLDLNPYAKLIYFIFYWFKGIFLFIYIKITHISILIKIIKKKIYINRYRRV